jgi:hypothetical protein
VVSLVSFQVESKGTRILKFQKVFKNCSRLVSPRPPFIFIVRSPTF